MIRRVEAGDRGEWLRMCMLLLPGPMEDHQHDIERLLSGAVAPAAVFVYDRGDGKLGGYVEVATRPYAEGCESSPVAYIEAWFVDADLRRSGVGRALIAAAEGWARQQGLREVASDALIDNEVSIASHKALGYEEVERQVCFRRAL